MLYAKTVRTNSAIRYIDDNVSDIVNFCQGRCRYDSEFNNLYLSDDSDETITEINNGDYVLLMGKQYFVYSQDEFNEKYYVLDS